MTNTSKTILFFGTENFSATSLEALITAGYTIGAVITKPDSKKGRGQKVTEPIVKTIAKRHNIPVWQPKKLIDIADNISRFSNPAGVLVSFGKIIPQSIIDLFSPGIINVHPSLLPLYRGPSPIETAILNGDTKSGVSIMLLSAAMDAGPVYAQKTTVLTGTETKPELYDHMAQAGSDLLMTHLDAILDNSLMPEPQDDSIATYTQLINKSDGHAEPNSMSATTIERMVRAYLDYPKTRVVFKNTTCILTRVHVATEPSETTIKCADSSLLEIDELIAPSGKTMTAQSYLRGLH